MADASTKHKAIRTDFSDPSPGGVSVTPSDGTDLSIPARALYIGGAGDVAVNTADGSELTFVGLLAGSILPVQVARVKSTGTTATNIVALK